MKLYLLEIGLRQRINFHKAIVFKDPRFIMSSSTLQKHTSSTWANKVAENFRKLRKDDPQQECSRRPN